MIDRVGRVGKSFLIVISMSQSEYEETRVRRMRSMGRSIKPIRRIGDLVCFNEADLYWLLSRTSIRRLGLD